MTGLMTAFLAQVGIITYRAYAGSGVPGGGIQVPATAPMNLPLPSWYTAPMFIYGALGLIPDSGQRVASMVGWGLVVATLLNLWQPGTGTATPSIKPLPSTTSTGGTSHG